MNQHIIINAVMDAIRSMQHTKDIDAILFIDNIVDWTYDANDICGIPVYHVSGVQTYYNDMISIDCPFMPITKKDGELTHRQLKDFVDSYEDSMIAFKRSQKTTNQKNK